MDCLERSHIALEGATEVSILARFEGTAITRLRTATPDCEIDAGGLPVLWLENVKPDDSATWLASLVNAPNADARERFNRVTKPAIELGAVQDDLLRMPRFDGAQWDREATGVLDVDYKNSPTALAKPGERRRAPRFRLK